MLTLPRALLCLALTAPGGCATFPEMGDVPSAKAVAPDLLPLDSLLAQVGTPTATVAVGNALAARAARLRARAALMQAPVMDPATRARLQAAIAAGQA
jgi:hypothetical protein